MREVKAPEYREKAEKPTPSVKAEGLSDQRRYKVAAKPAAVPEGLRVLYG